MHTKITLACTEYRQRNYNMIEDKKTHPDHTEAKKYCKFRKKRTMHKKTEQSCSVKDVKLWKRVQLTL